MEINKIEQLIKLVVANKIDRLKFGDIEIVKTRHDVAKTDNKLASNQDVIDEDELLYWSTSSPSLSKEQIDALSYVPQTRPKSRKSKA